MKAFARLCIELGTTRSTATKVAQLVDYFRAAPAEDAALALSFFLGRRLKRAVTTTELRRWVAEAGGLPSWLIDMSYESVGDLGETLALLLPDTARIPNDSDEPMASLAVVVRDGILPLAAAPPARRKAIVFAWWNRFDSDERFVYHKLIGGSFRIGVSSGLVLRAIAALTGVDLAIVTHRLSGPFDPTPESWERLLRGESPDDAPGCLYPFCLASSLEVPPADFDRMLGPVAAWQIERKYDGIRGQLLHRGATTAVWSRGEERIDGSFPELRDLARQLPDGTVLDGEVLLVIGDTIGSFAKLQTRINAKRSAVDAGPGLFDIERAVFFAYDVLEDDGVDIRGLPLQERRGRLERIVSSVDDPMLRLSPVLRPARWEDAAAERAQSRALGVEGLMLKRLDAPYGIGRQRGRTELAIASWLKWKIDPFSIDAVVIAAEAGHGRRANLLTDYTFGLWRGEELITIAKAYSGLTDEEIAMVDRQLRGTTHTKRGPVRFVDPTLVFELGFEGLQRSKRHKSGIALRFPRILRWRTDKKPADADSLSTLEALLAQTYG
ncbi:MAG: ATP-dependent DNA ligase [Phycisphaerae bacterium]|nr:ATP-dependent DNA ligase [Phycisphaerae bacterium]